MDIWVMSHLIEDECFDFLNHSGPQVVIQMIGLIFDVKIVAKRRSCGAAPFKSRDSQLDVAGKRTGTS